MQQTGWDRRRVLWALSAITGTAMLGTRARPVAAQQVKYSSGTEPPKLKAPANACDCHHHIYGVQYKVDPRSTLRPGDATVEDYRALQKRIGTSRNVIVQPSTYGIENAPTLDALVAFGPSARAVVVVDTTVTDPELKRMHGLGARGIRRPRKGARASPVLLLVNPVSLGCAGRTIVMANQTTLPSNPCGIRGT